MDKKIEKEKIDRILQAANRAPSARNLQSYKIFVIENQKIKEQLQEACRGQEFINQAGVCLVFVSWIEDSGVISERTGFFAQLDATIACYQAWLAAVDLGLSGVWIGAFSEEEIISLLDLKFGQQPIAVLPLGYSANTPELKERKELKDLVVEK